MPCTCCVKNCKSRGGLLRIFRIPMHPKSRRELWVEAIRQSGRVPSSEGIAWTPNMNHRVCQKHFITGQPSADEDHPDYVPTVCMRLVETPVSRGDMQRKEEIRRKREKYRALSKTQKQMLMMKEEERKLAETLRKKFTMEIQEEERRRLEELKITLEKEDEQRKRLAVLVTRRNNGELEKCSSIRFSVDSIREMENKETFPPTTTMGGLGTISLATPEALNSTSTGTDDGVLWDKGVVSSPPKSKKTQRRKDQGVQTDGSIQRVIHRCVRDTVFLKARLARLQAENKALRKGVEANVLSVLSTPGSVMESFSLTGHML